MKDWLVNNWSWDWLEAVPDTVVVIVGIVTILLVVALVIKLLKWVKE